MTKSRILGVWYSDGDCFFKACFDRICVLIFQDDVAAGKETNWWELEIAGTIRNVSPSVWKLTHLVTKHSEMTSRKKGLGLKPFSVRSIQWEADPLKTGLFKDQFSNG